MSTEKWHNTCMWTAKDHGWSCGSKWKFRLLSLSFPHSLILKFLFPSWLHLHGWADKNHWVPNKTIQRNIKQTLVIFSANEHLVWSWQSSTVFKEFFSCNSLVQYAVITTICCIVTFPHPIFFHMIGQKYPNESASKWHLSALALKYAWHQQDHFSIKWETTVYKLAPKKLFFLPFISI